MKVFISWSGDQSRAVAEALRNWLPDVVAHFEPWMSSEDLEKGARWTMDLATELEGTEVGIVCLTRDNLHAPWILYEAGALAKTVARSRVCTYLHGLSPGDVVGPLVQFQATEATRPDTYRMLHTLNEQLGAKRTGETTLNRRFDHWWPELERALEAASSLPPSAPVRPDRQVLEEVLDLVRQASKPSTGAVLGRSALVDFGALLHDLDAGRLPEEVMADPDGANAEDWAPMGSEREPGPLDGRWSCRWAARTRGALGAWHEGTAAVVQHAGTTVMHASDDTGEFLILAKQAPSGVLLGRYYNLAAVRETSPWRGVVVGPDRIDGKWAGGPWDFRRPVPG